MQFLSQTFFLLQFCPPCLDLCLQSCQMSHIVKIHDVSKSLSLYFCHLTYQLPSLRHEPLYFGPQLCYLHPLLGLPLWLFLQIGSSRTSFLRRRLRVNAFLRDVPLEDAIAVGRSWDLRSALGETAAFVECALLRNGEDAVIAIRQPDLPHFLNVDLVERVLQRDGSCLAVTEVELALWVFAGFPEGREGRLETFQRQVEILIVLGQHKSNELCVVDDFCMGRSVPFMSGSQSRLSSRMGISSFHFTFYMSVQIINYH